MEEVYRLFDRRCRMATALAKLESSGHGSAVRPAAEGAQEAAGAGVGEGAGVFGRAAAGRDVQRGGRGNRRYRKMQKTVYRVRTQRAIEGRLGWTCCGSSTPKAGLRPPRFCTRRGRHDAIARYRCYSLEDPVVCVSVSRTHYWYAHSIIYRYPFIERHPLLWAGSLFFGLISKLCSSYF